MSIIYVFALLALCSIAQLSTTPAQKELSCKVHLQVVDVFGRPLKYSVRSFVPVLGSGIDLAARFVGTTIDGLVPGGYTYLLEPMAVDSVYKQLSGRVRVHGQAQWLTIVGYKQTDPIVHYREGCLYPGRISPAPPVSNMNWVRLTGVYGDLGTDESPIEADGSFCFYDHREGEFLLSVFTGGRLSNMRSITFTHNFRGPLNLRARDAR
jgi:hypothetical protein